jgi:CRISPR-associated endonuclease Cas1
MGNDGQYPRPATTAQNQRRTARRVTPEQAADVLAGLEAGFSDDPAGPAVAVVLGAGAKVRVERGHLVADDGEGWFRRERSFNRATSRLARLVIGASSGYLTIDALAFCRDAGVALVVVDSDGEVMLAPGAYRADDGRLRRVQAAPPEPLAVEAAGMLLGPKLAGQAEVCRRVLERPDVAATIDGLAEAMRAVSDVEAVRQLEASAAAAYFGDAWCVHPATTLRFRRADACRLPAHWPLWNGRRSLLARGVSPRRAERPLNACLNLVYSLAVIEARLAALAVGLDPGLGFVHADGRGLDGLAFDLVEPVRPAVDRFVLDLVAERTFTRTDFVERSDGSVRLAPRLVQELAATMPRWAKLVAPHAEAIAHLLGRAVRGQYLPRTPLTGRKLRTAQSVVRARKVAAKRAATTATTARAVARRADGQMALVGTCVDCGGPLTRPRNLRCETCQEQTPGQSRAVRRQRGRAIAAARADLAEWRAEHPQDERPSAETFAPIRTGLDGIKLADIRAATGLSKSMASQIRSGRVVPHVRHWGALAELALAAAGNPRRAVARGSA